MGLTKTISFKRVLKGHSLMGQILWANAKFNLSLSLSSLKDDCYDIHFFSSRKLLQYDLTSGIICMKHDNFQYVVPGVYGMDVIM